MDGAAPKTQPTKGQTEAFAAGWFDELEGRTSNISPRLRRHYRMGRENAARLRGSWALTEHAKGLSYGEQLEARRRIEASVDRMIFAASASYQSPPCSQCVAVLLCDAGHLACSRFLRYTTSGKVEHVREAPRTVPSARMYERVWKEDTEEADE